MKVVELRFGIRREWEWAGGRVGRTPSPNSGSTSHSNRNSMTPAVAVPSSPLVTIPSPIFLSASYASQTLSSLCFACIHAGILTYQTELRNAQMPSRAGIKHIITPYSRLSGPTSRSYLMGFVFGIPCATMYLYRGLPIRKIKNVLVQHTNACLSCGFNNGHVLDIQ